MGVLRLLLALSVVLNHSYGIFKINLLGGPLAVQAFFIISGFYMSLILNEKYVQKGSYKLFITNRFMRIYPIYAVVLISSILFFIFNYNYPSTNTNVKFFFENPLGLTISHISDLSFTALFVLFFSNIFIFFQDIIMFLGVDSSGNLFWTSNFRLVDLPLYKFLMIPQAWSISLECMFYVFAPFLLRRNVKIILTIIFATFFIRFITYYNGYDNDPWSYRFFPFEFGYFLVGNISYLIYKKIRVANIQIKIKWAAFLFMVGLTLIYPVIKFNGSQYLYCLCFALCLPFIFFLTKNWKFDTFLGDLSYPIYLVHIVLLTMMKYLPGNLNIVFVGIIYLGSVILASIFLNEVVSKKIETIRKNRYLNFAKKAE